MTNYEEQSYLELMKKIINEGEEVIDRTKVGTKFIFGEQLSFSLKDNKLPLLTTKKVFFKGIVEELLFFMRGDTDTKNLEKVGVNIWKGNTSREFLDSKGLTDLPEGSLGKGYGYQWRNFNSQGIDQLYNVIKSIRENPFGRKHIISAWNPAQLNEMALEPCHYSMEFNVHTNKTLSCKFNQRSCDYFLGVPFNICSYALMTKIIANACGLDGNKVVFSGGNIHLYTNHIDKAMQQIERDPFEFPTCTIKNVYSDSIEETIKNIESLKLEDFVLNNYNSHGALNAIMAV